MASLAETRDNDTGHHIRRTQHYVRELAVCLRDQPNFAGQIDDGFISTIYKTAPLHDIDKMGVPDRILLKPGRLTLEKFEEMKKHTLYGRDATIDAEKSMDAPESFLLTAHDIAYCHHEKWDGTGYPQGLAGEAILLSARLMAIADVYDVLITKRVYEDAMPHEDVIKVIKIGKGTHFDPDVVDAFSSIKDRFAWSSAASNKPFRPTRFLLSICDDKVHMEVSLF